MKNKYVLTKKQNVAFVRENLPEFLYNSMILARYNVTREQVDHPELLPEGSEERIALDNFKETYEYLLCDNGEEPSYPVLLMLHRILMRGLMDTINNELTDEQIAILEDLINKPAKANTEIAIDVMLHILDKRLFADGDVRAAVMFSNMIMVNNGCGFITVKPDYAQTFRKLLKEFHEEDGEKEFKNWIFRCCIRGKRYEY